MNLEQGIIDHFLAHPKSTAYFSLDGAVALGPSQRHVLKAVDNGWIVNFCTKKERGEKTPYFEFIKLLHDNADLCITYICDAVRFQRVVKHVSEDGFWGDKKVKTPVLVYSLDVIDNNQKVTFQTSDELSTDIEIVYTSPMKNSKVCIRNFFDPVKNVVSESIDHALLEEQLEGEKKEELSSDEKLLSSLTSEYKENLRKLQSQFFQNLPRRILRGEERIPFQLAKSSTIEGRVMVKSTGAYTPWKYISEEEYHELMTKLGDAIYEGIQDLGMKGFQDARQKSKRQGMSADPERDIFQFYAPDTSKINYEVACFPGKPYVMNIGIKKDDIGKGFLDTFLKLVGMIPVGEDVS